jgi:multiple sugar transport system permease protein
MMITVFLFAFCWQWTDDFYIPLLFTGEKPFFMTYLPELTQIPTTLANNYSKVTGSSPAYKKAIQYGCGMMCCTPLVILYLFCQRYLVEGIERSGIVG